MTPKEKLPPSPLTQQEQQLFAGLELAWGVIANAYGGDWNSAPEVWRRAAIRWRDEVWFPALAAHGNRDSEMEAP